MNANQLADVIETVIAKSSVTLIGDFNLRETATMLRQQQAEIEDLKYQLKITRMVLNREQEK